jgi:hypothetical protein
MSAAAVPLPQSALARPDVAVAPAVAADQAEAVVVDLSRPTARGFRVRLYDESFLAPSEDVSEAWVLYGPGVRRLARELEQEWTSRGIRASSRDAVARCVEWTHADRYAEVRASIEALQRRHLP